MTQVRGDNVSNHPAFGMVSVNRIHSTGTTLFASDLRHAEIIELEIYEGQMVERDGVQNPARSTRRPLLSASVQLNGRLWFAALAWAKVFPVRSIASKPAIASASLRSNEWSPRVSALTETSKKQLKRQLANLAEDLQSVQNSSWPRGKPANAN
jgi:hypothetical protein